MTIAEILKLSAFILRDTAATMWKEQKNGERQQPLHFGAVLSRIKHENHFKDWGYRLFSHYCRSELVYYPTGGENFLIAAFDKIHKWNLTEQEICRMESLGIYKISKILKVSRTLDEFWANTKTLKLHGEEYRQKIAKTLVVRAEGEELDVVESFVRYLMKQLKITRSQALVALISVAKAHLDMSRKPYRERLLDISQTLRLPPRVVNFFAPY